MTSCTLLIMYYVTDEDKNQVELESALDAITVPLTTESISAVGLTLTIDGIECYGINGAVNKNTYITGTVRYSGTGNAIFVDKNHDLSYYVNGSDWVDSEEYNISPGTYGYEWGGNSSTDIKATAVGTGLSNTNSLIEMNLQPVTAGWYVVWDKIEEFRQSHSNNWFLPSKDELALIYEARNNLSNLSLNTQSSYWSSSEAGLRGAWYLEYYADSGMGAWQGINNKKLHYIRSRLCYTF